MDRARGAKTFRAAAQDDRIAGLEAEAAGIGGHVRPALVDDADHPERHAHALDAQAVRPRPGFRDRPDRVRQGTHDLDPLDHGGDALIVQHQAIHEGGGRPAGARLGDVLGVGGEDGGASRLHRGRHGGERTRLVGGPLGAAPDIAHHGGDIPRCFHGFERRRHGGCPAFRQAFSPRLSIMSPPGRRAGRWRRAGMVNRQACCGRERKTGFQKPAVLPATTQ